MQNNIIWINIEYALVININPKINIEYALIINMNPKTKIKQLNTINTANATKIGIHLTNHTQIRILAATRSILNLT